MSDAANRRPKEMDETARRSGFGPLAFTFGTIRYYVAPADTGALRTALLKWFDSVRIRGYIAKDQYVGVVDRAMGLVDTVDPMHPIVFDVDMGCMIGRRSKTRYQGVYLSPGLFRIGLISGFMHEPVGEETRSYNEYAARSAGGPGPLAGTAPAHADGALGFSLPAETHSPAAYSPVSRLRLPSPRDSCAEVETLAADAGVPTDDATPAVPTGDADAGAPTDDADSGVPTDGATPAVPAGPAPDSAGDEAADARVRESLEAVLSVARESETKHDVRAWVDTLAVAAARAAVLPALDPEFAAEAAADALRAVVAGRDDAPIALARALVAALRTRRG